MSNNYFTIITTVLIIVTIFTLINMVGDEVSDNSNLDTPSQLLVSNINSKISDDFSSEDFNQSTGLNGSFEGQDSFSREFFESKNSAETKTSLPERAIKIPELILLAIGVPKVWVNPIYVLVSVFIGIIISFATFNAFFNRRIDK